MLHHYFLARLVVGSYSSLRLPAPLALLSRPLSSILLFKCVCSSSPVQIARFCLLLTCRPSPSNPRRADDAFSRSFPSGVSHEGLETLFSRLQRKCLFTRQQALSIIDTLRSVETAEAEAGDDNNDSNAADAAAAAGDGLVVIDAEGGQRGVGKSAVLTHVVHWARSHGWVVLHIPSARELMEGGLWVQPSPYEEGSFDQPQVAQAILRDFAKAHGDGALGEVAVTLPVRASSLPYLYFLASLPRTHTSLISHAKRQAIKARFSSAATLRDLVELGLNDENEASQALSDVRLQLAKQSTHCALVAIDDYNLLYGETSYFFEQAAVTADSLTVVKALRDGAPLQRGAMVVAESNSKGSRLPSAIKRSCSQRVTLPRRMTECEIGGLLDFMSESGVLNHDSDSTRALLAVTSQRLFSEVVRRCMLS